MATIVTRIAKGSALTYQEADDNWTGLNTEVAGKQPLSAVLTATTASFTTADETKLDGIAAAATANATDASLRDRATHTGTQVAATVSDFSAAADARIGAAVINALSDVVITTPSTGQALKYDGANWTNQADATGGGGVSDGDKGDITVSASGATWTVDAGAITLAKQADVATSTVFYRKTAATGSPEVQTLATLKTDLGLTGTNSGDQTITLSGDATGTGTAGVAVTLATVNANVGSFGLTSSVAQFTVNAKGLITAAANVAISVASAAISDSTAAGRAFLTAATAAAQTALLSVFVPSGAGSAKGLVPDPGVTAGTTKFLREDATWVVPTATAAPAGASGEVQYNNAGVTAGAADVEIEGGQLRLPAIATPTAPAAGGVKMFGRDYGGRMLPAMIGPSGLNTSLQPLLAANRVSMFLPHGTGTIVTTWGFSAAAPLGTATGAVPATTNRFTYMKGIEYLVTAAATTAIAVFRGTANQYWVGGVGAGDGGFTMVTRWGPATGVATATTRGFCGMMPTAVLTDAEPSASLNIIGMGWDAADANIQFMHNDGAGVATKIDLGASFPVPTVDRTSCYEIVMFSPTGPTQSVSYRITDLTSGAETTGTVTTNLPTTATAIAPILGRLSAGGTSSVIGIKIFSHYIETDF